MRLPEYSYPPRGTRGWCDIGLLMRVATLSEMLEEVVRLGEAAGMEAHARELRGDGCEQQEDEWASGVHTPATLPRPGCEVAGAAKT